MAIMPDSSGTKESSDISKNGLIRRIWPLSCLQFYQYSKSCDRLADPWNQFGKKNDRIMNQKNQGIAGKKKTSVLLHLDTSHQRKEDGKSRFYLKVRVQGKPQLYDILPEVHMDRKYWIHETDESGAEKKKMRIQHSKGNPDSRRLEVTLLGKLGEMTAIIEDLGNQGHAVTHAMIGQRWKGTGIKTLVEYIEARMEDERAEVRASTFIKWRSCLRAIRGYDPQVLLTEVTPEWLRGYEEYMRHTKPHVRIMETMGSERS